MRLRAGSDSDAVNSLTLPWPIAAARLVGVERGGVGFCVELRSLLGVDLAGRYPFRQPILVDAAGPTLLHEMGVVVAAEQITGPLSGVGVGLAQYWPGRPRA